ncbi:hypothetical protein D3C86_2178140 [compost metagenome]
MLVALVEFIEALTRHLGAGLVEAHEVVNPLRPLNAGDGWILSPDALIECGAGGL